MFYKNFLAKNFILIIKHIFTTLKNLNFFIKTLKNSEKNHFSILKVTGTEDFGTDLHPDL